MELREILNGREIAFISIVGSHNYNLADEQSDVDYKYFVFPNFDDLYSRSFFSAPAQITAEMDYDLHDIRKLPDMWFKANINFIEVLFSINVKRPAIYTQISQLLEKRDAIARMNLPYLYHACKGMHYNKMSCLYKGTESTKVLVEQFGYDTKQAMCAYRVLDFCNRFYANGWTDFRAAMSYDGSERDFLIGMKRGKLTEEEFHLALSPVMEKFNSLEEEYNKCGVDYKLMDEVRLTIKDAVKLSTLRWN